VARRAARVQIDEDRVTVTGVQIGVSPMAYRVDHVLGTTTGWVTRAGQVDLPAPGGGTAALGDALDCDLGLSPLSNTMPILRHRLHERPGAADLTMAWVSVPDLTVHRSLQRYEHVRRTPDGAVVRFVSGNFTAELLVDADGFVVDYPQLARLTSGGDARRHHGRAPIRNPRAGMMTTEPKSATFETTVASSGNNTGIIVPVEVIERLGAGKRPPVLVDVNGHQYRSTAAVMGGKHMIGISAAVRAATGLKGGDPIRVRLTVADTPREVDVPADFAAALAGEEGTSAFFEKLANSLQRYHVDTINGARTPETRQRRIEKAVTLFREGKQR
jgi:hypothetical protein